MFRGTGIEYLYATIGELSIGFMLILLGIILKYSRIGEPTRVFGIALLAGWALSTAILGAIGFAAFS